MAVRPDLRQVFSYLGGSPRDDRILGVNGGHMAWYASCWSTCFVYATDKRWLSLLFFIHSFCTVTDFSAETLPIGVSVFDKSLFTITNGRSNNKQGSHRHQTPPRYGNASPYDLLRSNVTSSIEPKIHNVSQRRQRRTEPRPQGSAQKNREDRSRGSKDMLADRETHRQTDKLIAILRSLT